MKKENLNESPFWIPMKFNTEWKSMHDFFMPKKLWKIGELINHDKRVILNDIIMIELYHASMPDVCFPDYYIDLDNNEEMFSTIEHFFEGRYLLASGYPLYLVFLS